MLMSIQETPKSATLPVAEVITIVREWVELHASKLPDFAGAYLWGGLTALPADAPFHLYRDVDVVVVFTQDAPDEEQEVSYRGLILEVISKNLESHHSAETILADPSAGPNMATTQILADPTGILLPLHHAVVADYRRRRWIQARCDAEKADAQEWLTAMHKAVTPDERMIAARVFLGALSGLLAVAQLKRPTTRRTLALLRELLEAQGRTDLNESALAVMGSAHLSRADVQLLFEHTILAVDRAVEVYKTVIPYGFALRSHIRPYYVEGTLEMLNEGNHREAMFWISCLDTAYFALQNDAPDAEKSVFAEHYQAMHTMLGNTSAEGWAKRVDTATHLAAEIDTLANTLVALYPE
jgi:hypothetical protein